MAKEALNEDTTRAKPGVLRATDNQGRDILFGTTVAQVGKHRAALEGLVDGFGVRPQDHDVVHTSRERGRDEGCGSAPDVDADLLLQRVEPTLPAEEHLHKYQ